MAHQGQNGNHRGKMGPWWPIAARQWAVIDSATPKEQSMLASFPAAV
jgi:hypothetical protein